MENFSRSKGGESFEFDFGGAGAGGGAKKPIGKPPRCTVHPFVIFLLISFIVCYDVVVTSIPLSLFFYQIFSALDLLN